MKKRAAITANKKKKKKTYPVKGKPTAKEMRKNLSDLLAGMPTVAAEDLDTGVLPFKAEPFPLKPSEVEFWQRVFFTLLARGALVRDAIVGADEAAVAVRQLSKTGL